jgi:hypothetical protein
VAHAHGDSEDCAIRLSRLRTRARAFRAVGQVRRSLQEIAGAADETFKAFVHGSRAVQVRFQRRACARPRVAVRTLFRPGDDSRAIGNQFPIPHRRARDLGVLYDILRFAIRNRSCLAGAQEAQFKNWESRDTFDAAYESGRVTDTTLNVELPETPATYYLVFSNRFSLWSN